MTIITLVTDFGLRDPYVAQMKAVIRSIAPAAEIVDISHGVNKHSIVAGSFILETTLPFLPGGSIHVAVVDPGVGGSRLPIVVKCDKGVLVGPDNGLLSRAGELLGVRAAYQIQNSEFLRPKVSSTFQGRDVFAYAAARIALGADPARAGPKLSRIARLDIPDPVFSKHGVVCHVLYVDSFGNVVTNVSESNMDKLEFREGRHVKVLTDKLEGSSEGATVKSYFEIPVDGFGLLLGSQGYLEVAVREDSAAERLHVKPLDRLEISLS